MGVLLFDLLKARTITYSTLLYLGAYEYRRTGTHSYFSLSYCTRKRPAFPSIDYSSRYIEQADCLKRGFLVFKYGHFIKNSN
jgi:hypothetical protein